jgi:hypothetical protein
MQELEGTFKQHQLESQKPKVEYRIQLNELMQEFART